MSDGQLTRGGVVSTTVTVNAQLLDRPPLSVAVQTTLLVPKRKPVPEGGTHVTGTGAPEESTAVTVNVTGVRPPVHSATTLGGQVIIGSSTRRTVTVKLHELELPTLSVARQVTVVVPIGKLPGGGAQSRVPMPHGSKALAV